MGCFSRGSPASAKALRASCGRAAKAGGNERPQARNTRIAALAAFVLAIVCALLTATTWAMAASTRSFTAGPQAALETAIRADDVERIAAAIANGASVNATGKFDVTPLMVAVDAQRPRAVQALLKAGASPNAVAQDGKSRWPLSLALKGTYPSPDSPLYPYKRRIWQLLDGTGIAVPPFAN